MGENSVGRLWLEGNPNEKLKSKWKYYVDEAKQDFDVENELIKIRKTSKINNPEEIKVIDPCMVSGYILVYIFDLLMDIYISEGYVKSDVAKLILSKNIYGLDIDDRAYQISYFALMMKARQYNRRIFDENIFPMICPIQESNNFSDNLIENMGLEFPEIKNSLNYICTIFNDAKEYGSIIDVDKSKIMGLHETLRDLDNYQNLDLAYNLNSLKWISIQSLLLSKKYDVVVTNPPYMGNKSMGKKLVNYLKDNYPISKLDLSTVFMEKSVDLVKKNGLVAMINIPVWMFLSSYENLREYLLNNTTFINMIHLGRGCVRV